jgi:8-oxo-dGTP pyrophosphatase MutT (NUDIX family)
LFIIIYSKYLSFEERFGFFLYLFLLNSYRTIIENQFKKLYNFKMSLKEPSMYIKNIIFVISFVILSSHSLLEACTLNCSKGKVERAGVVLLKKYKSATGHMVPCILLGQDARLHYVNFPGGGCEKKDVTSVHTAMRETMEETGGLLKLPHLGMAPYIYSPHHKIQLFVYRDDNLSVRKLASSVKMACQNKRLPYAYREVNDYYAVPVQSVLDAAKEIMRYGFPQSKSLPRPGMAKAGFNHRKQPVYQLISNSGKPIQLHYAYLSAIARDYMNAKQIFERAFSCKFR